jgi:gamma-glutamylputrescine oxidase
MHMLNRDSNDALVATADYPKSYYASTVTEKVRATQFAGAVECDTCIVGGGYTGLAAALHLARRGINVALLEQSLLGWGASGRNGGQVHVGIRRDQHWAEKHLGPIHAHTLWQQALRAREHLDWLIQTYSIDCGLRLGLLHADHRMRYTGHSRRYAEYLRRAYGYEHIRVIERDEMRALVATRDYVGGTFDGLGGHLHALNLALGIGRAAQSHGAVLYENARVERMEQRGAAWELHTPRGTVRARQVLLACNGYLRGLSPVVEKHVMPINNFIAVTHPLGEGFAAELIRHGYAVSDSRFVVYYFRMTPDHRLLFGGGENYSYRFPRDIAGFVRKHMTRIFPQLADVPIDFAWGGTLAITPSRMPFIRELQPGLYSASGYSGMGVVLAPYIGRVLAEAMTGDRTDFAQWSSIPATRFPGGVALRVPTLVAAMSLAALRDHV